MKLTDKRFWKFEALMLLCGMISIVINPLLYTFGPDIYWENYKSGLYFFLFIIVYPLPAVVPGSLSEKLPHGGKER